MDDSPLEILAHREEVGELIARLTRDGRDMLLVTLIMSGMDAGEIARVMRISAPHVHRMRERLAQELAEYAGWLAQERRRRTGAWPARRSRE